MTNPLRNGPSLTAVTFQSKMTLLICVDLLASDLTIYGFPERVEDEDTISFLRATLPQILGADFEGGLDLEHAHRSLLPAKPRAPPRPFIVRFLRFQQKEKVRLERSGMSAGRTIRLASIKTSPKLHRSIDTLFWNTNVCFTRPKSCLASAVLLCFHSQLQTGLSIALKIIRRL